MKRKFLIFSIIQLFVLIQIHGQDGKLFTIINQDTVSVKKSGIEVFIVVNTDTLKFHKNDSLTYPLIEGNNSIKSILVIVADIQYEFFNKSKANLPPALIEAMGPFYKDIFADQRNMYVTLKNKSDMFDDLPKSMMPQDTLIEKQKSTGQLTLYYQQEVTIPVKQ